MQGVIVTLPVKRRQFPMYVAALVVAGKIIHSEERWSEGGAVADLSAWMVANKVESAPVL